MPGEERHRVAGVSRTLVTAVTGGQGRVARVCGRHCARQSLTCSDSKIAAQMFSHINIIQAVRKKTVFRFGVFSESHHQFAIIYIYSVCMSSSCIILFVSTQFKTRQNDRPIPSHIFNYRPGRRPGAAPAGGPRSVLNKFRIEDGGP